LRVVKCINLIVVSQAAFLTVFQGRGTQVAKGEVCKTFIQGFESPPRLQHFLTDAIRLTC
jgi:hypothetical protein